MTVHNLLVGQALVLMESTPSLVIVLDLDTLEQYVTRTLMNVKLKTLAILMLLVLTTKALTSVTVNQDLTERIVTKILMTVEATHVKMEVCLIYMMTNEANMHQIYSICINHLLLSSVIYLVTSFLFFINLEYSVFILNNNTF